jgi:hypothetical protein
MPDSKSQFLIDNHLSEKYDYLTPDGQKSGCFRLCRKGVSRTTYCP